MWSALLTLGGIGSLVATAVFASRRMGDQPGESLRDTLFAVIFAVIFLACFIAGS